MRVASSCFSQFFSFFKDGVHGNIEEGRVACPWGRSSWRHRHGSAGAFAAIARNSITAPIATFRAFAQSTRTVVATAKAHLLSFPSDIFSKKSPLMLCSFIFFPSFPCDWLTASRMWNPLVISVDISGRAADVASNSHELPGECDFTALAFEHAPPSPSPTLRVGKSTMLSKKKGRKKQYFCTNLVPLQRSEPWVPNGSCFACRLPAS